MIAALLAAVLAPPASATLPARWAHWKYERAIHTTAEGSTSIVVPPTIYANAKPNLADVRVVDANGVEVPFALVVPPSGPSTVWIESTVTDEGFVAGKYSQAVADLGARHQAYSLLDLETSLGSFATHVDVDASDEGKTWRTIREGAAIYDYASDGLATNTRVPFPPSTARYVRVRVLDPARAFPIAGIRFATQSPAPAPERYRVRLSPPRRDASGTTTYELGGFAQVPIDALRIDASEPSYVRDVDVQTSDDGTAWQTIASVTIARTSVRHVADVTFDETQAPRWRIAIHDGNDAPLRGVAVGAFGLARRIAFDAAPGIAYRLLYGNPQAEAPSYDYAQTHVLTTAGTLGAALGNPKRNPGFVSAVPWSERNPWLLWIALAIAVVAVGTLAVRTMATTPGDGH